MAITIFSWQISTTLANAGPNTIASDDDEQEDAADAEAVAFINKIATPTDCIIAGDPVFLFETGRLPPPQLSEVSKTRIETGYLTLQDITQAISVYNCHVVVALTDRLQEDIAGLPEWLTKNYLGFYQNNEVWVYFAKKEPEQPPTPISAASFGEQISLYGLGLSDQPWQNTGYVSLYWQLQAPLQPNLVEKIGLQPAEGNMPDFYITRQLFDGQFDPTAWAVHEQVRDTFQLTLPPELPNGVYHVTLSLCFAETPECLPIHGKQDETELMLGQIEVSR